MDYKKCLTDDELSNDMGGTNFTKILRACDEPDTNTFFSLYDEIKEFINTKFDHPRFYKMCAYLYYIISTEMPLCNQMQPSVDKLKSQLYGVQPFDLICFHCSNDRKAT